MCVQRVLGNLYEAFEVGYDGYKQLERLLVCLRPSESIEGLFSVQVHNSSAQLCLQRVFDKLCLCPSECIEVLFSFFVKKN